MVQVVLMRAIPGSGKSTYAKQLIDKAIANGKKAIACSADDYFYELGQGTYAFDRTKIADAHNYCFKKFMKAINENVDLIIVDNTNLTAWEISPYKMYAEAHDYDFSINEIKADQEKSFKRQQHGIPDFVHKTMSRSFHEESLPPWWKKETFTSGTSPTGEPVFEREVPDKETQKNSSRRADKLLKLAYSFSKLAIK